MYDGQQQGQAAQGTGQGGYQERWAADRPGCLIILIDQSASMDEAVGSGLVGAGQKKSEAAAMALNNVLNELQKRSQSGTVVRPRVDVSVIGYGPGGSVHSGLGGNLANYDIVSITDLAANPIRVNRVMVSEFNINTGALDQVPMDVPIWVEPVADNGTPMCMALQTAFSIAQNWVANNHASNFPPIIVNITDGEANDGDPVPYAQQISSQVFTNDGYALVFNCHISSKAGFQVKYPSDISQVPPTDPLAQQLYQMSSVLPQGMIDVGNAMGMTVQPGARGFVFGADVADMANFITIASLAKADPSMR